MFGLIDFLYCYFTISSLPDEECKSVMKTILDVDNFYKNNAKNKLLHNHLYQINKQNDMKVVHEDGHQREIIVEL